VDSLVRPLATAVRKLHPTPAPKRAAA
jgi:hypothetical protein